MTENTTNEAEMIAMQATGNGEVAANNTPNMPEARSVQGEIIVPRRIGPLHKLSGARREMARVYREMRRGTIDPQIGTKLVYTLASLGKVLEIETIEARLDRLEQAAEQIREVR